MKIRINSLPVKIFALFWLTFVLLLVLAFFIPQLDTRLYSELKPNEVRGYHQEIVNAIRTNQFSRLLVAPDIYIEEKGNVSRPVLVDNESNVIGAKPDEINLVRNFMEGADDSMQPLRKSFNNVSISGPFDIHLNNDELQVAYKIYFISYVNPQKELVNYFFDRPLLLLLVLMVISTPVLAWLAYSLAKPIHRLQRAANAVALGDFTVNRQLETSGTVELRQVGKSFNHMSQTLGDFILSHRKMMSAISHELRTPLTRLQLVVGLMRRKNGDSTELDRIEIEIARLNKMVGDLLLASRSQMQDTIYRENVSIPQIWQEVVQDAYFEAEQMQIKMKVHQGIKHPERYFIYGNLDGLSSALENVIRNALKYTNSLIEVKFALQDKYVIIHIDDDGEGLDEDEYMRIFSPFYRVDEERTKKTQGTGLGLTIVRNTIQAHQGEVWAEKSHLGGLRVVIKFPVWKE
ncbi:hypothetical protein A4G18_03315 [Pasteurellaceae bacterium Pebbles2]|nr:hypothetical protein [Pasteurellaceae bacterium Pebbles2]